MDPCDESIDDVIVPDSGVGGLPSRGGGAQGQSRTLPQLTKLTPVALRSVFAHEALVFTPWLAEHLDELGRELHLGELTLIGTEQRVGDFAIDIVAETLTGDRVIVENQLERSDHTHLGQILTYAAGVGATVIVWVLPELREEHRAALDWLNENTIDSINFFGVEDSLVQIDSSAPTPMFSVEARPNGWQKRARTRTAGKTGEASAPSQGWQWLYDALAAIPAGRWTSYQDLAELGGTSSAWVGRHLYGRWSLPGLHRMLDPQGRPWSYFQWPDPTDDRDAVEVLRAEGAVAPTAAIANPTRRLAADDFRTRSGAADSAKG